MSKRVLSVLLSVLLMALISGCGIQQMDAIEKIRAQETMTVDELALLARTEDIVFTLQESWQPKEEETPLTVMQTRAGDLLLIWDSAQIAGGRAAIEQAGWAPRFWWANEEKPAVVEQALAHYGQYPAEQYFCYPFTAKNLLIYALIPGQTVTKQGVQQKAVYYQTRSGNLNALRQLFWKDINNMLEGSFQAVSENYAVHIGYSHYSTPTNNNDVTCYDNAAQYLLTCQVLNPQAFTTGETITMAVQGPFPGMTAEMSVTLEEVTAETVWVLKWGPDVSVTEEPMDGPAQYTVIITSGGHTETLELEEQLQATVSYYLE